MFRDTISLTAFALSFDQGQVHNTQVRVLRCSDGRSSAYNAKRPMEISIINSFIFQSMEGSRVLGSQTGIHEVV
jgi:hypothetical protein